VSAEHRYELRVEWTGDDGAGTASYDGYRRDHTISGPGKPELLGSSETAFRGDAGRYNPEELLLASLSACHLLWYLSSCAVARVVVVGYEDDPVGTMAEEPGGAGRFTDVLLRPRVVVAESSMVERARSLHGAAHRNCFIARSVNFPVRHEPQVSALR
jgi:organic hydroperoxide reductase OsmC/OhrA